MESTKVKLNNGLEIPRLGFGVWQLDFGKQTEQAVRNALEAGYIHIDTAAIYGNETSVGVALKQSGISRDKIFVTTKLWNEDHVDPERALKTSLQRLQMDYVDLFLIHFPVEGSRLKAWEVLEKLYEEGKCRAIGVSNFTIRHLEELMANSKIIPAVNQVEFHPFLYQRDLLEFCNKNQIQLEAYSPLTHGKKLNDAKLKVIAYKYSKSTAQLLLRWALQHDIVVIPKSSKKERIIENSQVFDFNLSAEDMEALDNLHENLRTCWDPTNVP